MAKLSPVVGALALAVFMSGCTTFGNNWERVPADDLVLGQTTQASITERMGSPRRVSDEIRNGHEIETVYYIGVETHSDRGPIPGAGAARSQVFNFADGVLVGYQFSSNFKSESTDFDESAVSSFTEGKTTGAEIIATLGQPGGRSIFPMVEEKGDTALRYGYSYIDTRKFGIPGHTEGLWVVLGPDDVAKDIELTVTDRP